tara:strand:+ start:13952 stop:14554 length:603 start_codon:yes stop_codon:yes gene_type:complete
MPRKNLIRTSDYPYHITIRSNNREWFELEPDVMWQICLSALAKANELCPANIEAFVLMANHYHLLLWTPNSDIDRFMYELNSSISKAVRKRTGRINRIFGDRYKWTLVDQDSYYNCVLRYIYQNPIHANTVERCEQYAYSSLTYLVQDFDLGFSLFNAQKSLQLFNSGYFEKGYEDRDKIKKALGRAKFSMPKNSARRLI